MKAQKIFQDWSRNSKSYNIVILIILTIIIITIIIIILMIIIIIIIIIIVTMTIILIIIIIIILYYIFIIVVLIFNDINMKLISSEVLAWKIKRKTIPLLSLPLPLPLLPYKHNCSSGYPILLIWLPVYSLYRHSSHMYVLTITKYGATVLFYGTILFYSFFNTYISTFWNFLLLLLFMILSKFFLFFLFYPKLRFALDLFSFFFYFFKCVCFIFILGTYRRKFFANIFYLYLYLVIYE